MHCACLFSPVREEMYYDWWDNFLKSQLVSQKTTKPRKKKGRKNKKNNEKAINK